MQYLREYISLHYFFKLSILKSRLHAEYKKPKILEIGQTEKLLKKA